MASRAPPAVPVLFLDVLVPQLIPTTRVADSAADARLPRRRNPQGLVEEKEIVEGRRRRRAAGGSALKLEPLEWVVDVGFESGDRWVLADAS